MKRPILSLVALGALLATVAGCGGSGKPATTGPQPAPAGQPAAQQSSGGEAKELVVAAYGGSFEKEFKAKVLPEFEKKYGVKVTYITGVSTDTLAKLQAQKDRPQIDVAIMDDGPQAQAKALGLLEKIDPAKVPNLANVYDIARDKDDVGVGIGVVATGIAYNTKYFQDNKLQPPTSWTDLARPEFKGKLVLQAFSNTYGVHTLVMLARAGGGGEQNIEPGFAKMKEIAPLAVTFEKSADVSNFFLQGQAVVAPWSTSRTYTLAAKGFPIEFVYPKEGAPALFVMASPVKNAPHPELAQTFIDFLLDELAQKTIAEAVFFGPTNKTVKLAEDVQKKVVYGEQGFQALTKMDWATINQNRAAWNERWSKEIEK